MKNRPSLIMFALVCAACGDDDAPGGSLDGGSQDAPVDASPLGDTNGDPVDGGAVDAGAPDADPAAPTCTITGPVDGAETPFDVAIQLTATATDPEDGALSGASVVWRTDQQVAPLGSGTALITPLPVGTNVVTCTATDSDAKTGTASITVISRSPVAQINHPSSSDPPRPSAAPVPFVGTGRDFEDGSLTGASLVWTSSLDGMIGTGEMFSQQLSPGMHTITLTVTDADGNTGSASVTQTMTP